MLIHAPGENVDYPELKSRGEVTLKQRWEREVRNSLKKKLGRKPTEEEFKDELLCRDR